jgi:outer membrane usher protein
VGYGLAIRCAGQIGIRAWAIIFVGAVLLVTTAFSRPVAWAGDPRAFLSLSVNGIDCGTVIAVVRSADVLLPTDDLKKAGLSLSGAKSETIGSDSFVSLASLAPDFHYEFDQRSLSIKVTASASSFRSTNLDLALGAPAGLEFRSDPAAFLNYSLTTANFNSVSGFFEGGVTVDHLLLYSGLSLEMSNLVRGLTNLVWDDRVNLRRLTLGDIALSAPALGGGPFIGGLTLQKNFSLNPYFIQFPTQNISGSVTAPSTAYVYRNGVLINEVQLAPGQFNLQQIPGLSGVSNTQVVIRNAFGGSQTINAPFYLGATLLEPGLSSYQYSIGELRNNLATSGWAYGPLAFSASHSIGVTPWFTPGYRLEGTKDFISSGPQVTVGSPFGVAQVALAASRDKTQGSGAAASFLYQFLSPVFGVDTQLQWMSPHYSNLSMPPRFDRPIVQTNSSLSYTLGKASLGLQHIYARSRNAETQNGGTTLHQILASLSLTIVEKANLSVTLGHSLPGNHLPANQAFLGLSYYLGNETSATMSYAHEEAQSTAIGSIQRSLPFGSGYGYMVQAAGGSSGSPQQAAMLQYQTEKNYFEGDYNHFGDQHSGTFTVAGGIIGIGNRLFLTRPVQNGFALVRVPGASNVECEWSNQSVGTTDRAGDCLYPNLLPYFGNQLGINDNDIPLNFSVGATQKTVAVPYRGGAVITFPVHRIHQVMGNLVVIDGLKEIIPANGQLTLSSQPSQTSPIGDGGAFYFEDIPIGTTKALVEYKGGTCAVDLVVPEFKEPLHKMGTVICKSR